MTPRSRNPQRRRTDRARARPPASGGSDATELIGRIPDWDGTAITFGGRSVIDPAAPGGPQWLAPPVRPEPLPALPPAPPRRPQDAAIFVLLPSGFGLLCGMDLWRRHADPEANHYRHAFDALRVSALRAGWQPDAYGRWCCPRCVADPAWATPKPLAHWHPAGAHARPGPGSPSWASRECWLARPATEYHEDAAEAWIAGDPAAEFWFAVEAEVEALARTADGAVHGRHAAVAR